MDGHIWTYWQFFFLFPPLVHHFLYSRVADLKFFQGLFKASIDMSCNKIFYFIRRSFSIRFEMSICDLDGIHVDVSWLISYTCTKHFKRSVFSFITDVRYYPPTIIIGWSTLKYNVENDLYRFLLFYFTFILYQYYTENSSATSPLTENVEMWQIWGKVFFFFLCVAKLAI